ncbi:DUF1449 family protein [Desulfobacterales bacterium HSG16]|nr:DUF1449 family protein [Desulfobacterales bacterium HSG16]
MLEYLRFAITPLNLPFTIFLGVVMLYWLAVIIGAADMDMFHADMDMDMDIDGVEGVGHSLFHFLNIGDVPVMVIISVMAFGGWAFSMITNFYFNRPGDILLGLGLLVPNLIVTLLVGSVILRPVAKLFKSLNYEDKEAQKIVYRVGRVVSGEVNNEFGQVEMETEGAIITINARIPDGLPLKKGERVLVFDEDKEKNVYFVEKFTE